MLPQTWQGTTVVHAVLVGLSVVPSLLLPLCRQHTSSGSQAAAAAGTAGRGAESGDMGLGPHLRLGSAIGTTSLNSAFSESHSRWLALLWASGSYSSTPTCQPHPRQPGRHARQPQAGEAAWLVLQARPVHAALPGAGVCSAPGGRQHLWRQTHRVHHMRLREEQLQEGDVVQHHDALHDGEQVVQALCVLQILALLQPGAISTPAGLAGWQLGACCGVRPESAR